MAEIMICGRDCHSGDENCNGYCRGDAKHPPEATPEMVLERKRKRAFEAYEDACAEWHDYFAECPVGPDRTYAYEVYENIRRSVVVGR